MFDIGDGGLATLAGLSGPTALFLDSNNNLYFTERLVNSNVLPGICPQTNIILIVSIALCVWLLSTQ